jgi:hypothetical protein
VITINMNNAALCRLEQQDRGRTGALPERRSTAAGTGLLDSRETGRETGRETARRPDEAPPMPEHTRG